jgi:glucose dehydrogenase
MSLQSNRRKPPHVLGGLLALLGAALLMGGFGIYSMGGGVYFLLVGAGLAYVGTLIFMGKMLGIWLYVGLLLMMAVMTLVEVGLDFPQLLVRLGLPLLIGVYLFSDRVRPRLA